MTVFVVIFGGETRNSDYPDAMPKDFNFVMKIHNSSYIIDTYKNTLTKAIDWDKDTTISFHFSDKEKLKQYKNLTELDIYKYPPNYAPTTTIQKSPSLDYFLSFTMNGIEWTINWTENTESEIKDAKKLRNLFLELLEYIEKDERVKKLPQSERAFL